MKLHDARNEMERLRQVESTQKASLAGMEDMKELIARLKQELAKERDEKARVEEERDRIQIHIYGRKGG